MGLHELDGLDILDAKRAIFDDLGIFDHIELVRLPEFFRFIKGRTDFVMPDDSEKATAALVAQFPDEEKGIRTFFKQLRGIRSEMPGIPRTKLWQIILYPLYPLLFPHVVGNAQKSVGDFLDSHDRQAGTAHPRHQKIY